MRYMRWSLLEMNCREFIEEKNYGIELSPSIQVEKHSLVLVGELGGQLDQNISLMILKKIKKSLVTKQVVLFRKYWPRL